MTRTFNNFSVFIFKQVATCGTQCKKRCFEPPTPGQDPRGYPGWDVCFGFKLNQPDGKWVGTEANDAKFVQCRCGHSRVCRKPGE